MKLKRSDEWIKQHLLTVGSTASAVVAYESPYRTAAQLFDVMREAQAGVIAETQVTDDMKRGILTEPLHRQLLEDEIGVTVHDHDQDKFLTNDKYPWAHALPDGWLLSTGEEIPVQLKCPRSRSWHEIKLKGLHGHWLLGSQHTLAITGAAYEYFSVLNVETMRLIHFPVYPDPELIAWLMDIERKFYARFLEGVRPEEEYVKPLDMPDIGGDGSLLQLTDDNALAASAAYLEADELLAESENLKEFAVSRIKDLIGEARVAELPGLRVYHTPQDGRVTLDKKAMQKDGIELAKYEKRGQPFTTFRGFRLGR